MLSAILAAGAVPLVITALRRAQIHGRWVAAFEGAARTLRGDVGRGTTRTGPTLWAEVDGVTVTVHVREATQVARTILAADAVLGAQAPSARLYLGWGVRGPPAELAHIPEVRADLRRRFDRPVFVRSDAPPVAEVFVEGDAAALGAFLRAAPARATEVLFRGGRVHLALHGPSVEAGLVVRLVQETARLRQAMSGDADAARFRARRQEVTRSGPTDPVGPASRPTEPATPASSDTAPSAPSALEAAATAPSPVAAAPTAPSPRAAAPTVPPPARLDVACHVCAEHSRVVPAEPWVRCQRCDTPYHERCWGVATGCVATGCVETRTFPL